MVLHLLHPGTMKYYHQAVEQKLTFNHPIFKILSVILVILGLIVSIIDLKFVKDDLTESEGGVIVAFLILIILFDFVKLYYVLVDVFVLSLIAAIIIIILTSIVIYKLNILKEQSEDDRKIRGIAEFGLAVICASVVLLFIYYYPSLHIIFSPQWKQEIYDIISTDKRNNHLTL